MYSSNRNFEIVHTSFEESETEESASSLSEMRSLNDDFVRMDLESGNSDEEITDEEVDSQVWSEIQSEFFTSSHDRFRPCLRVSSGGLFIFIITRRL